MISSQNNIYILGSGYFGQKAALLLQKRIKKGMITIVDHQAKSLTAAKAIGCQTITMDVITFLVNMADKLSPEDWIVPAVPFHVAFAWLQRVLGIDHQLKKISVPDSIGSHVPNPMWGAEGQVLTSIATFLCPDDCIEPQKSCTFTGKPRTLTLWKILSNLDLPGFYSICIRSIQLAPGVGGFQLRSLPLAFKSVLNNPGHILISTACRCHGVINAFTVKMDLQSRSEHDH